MQILEASDQNTRVRHGPGRPLELALLLLDEDEGLVVGRHLQGLVEHQALGQGHLPGQYAVRMAQVGPWRKAWNKHPSTKFRLLSVQE